jgi:diguanylate cyclase (GGDEF)-like protein
MRFVRFGALIGSLVLIVASLSALVDRLAAQQHETELREQFTASQVAERIEGDVAAMRVALQTAAAVGQFDLDALGAAAGPMVTVCRDDLSLTMCAGPDSGRAPAVLAALDVDTTLGRTLVTGPATADAPVVIAVPTTTGSLFGLVWIEDRLVVESYDVSLTAVPVADDGVIDSTLAGVFGADWVDGPYAVSAVSLDPARLDTDEWWFFGLLAGLGMLLLGLGAAAWMADQRVLRSRATVDELTGLLNRSEFERRAEIALANARRHDTSAAVMLVDLDDFKTINDTRGHQFGDLVLTAAAERIRTAVREGDIIGRWGGDEFVVLLPGVDNGATARARAGRVTTALSSTPLIGDVGVTASLGVALFPRHGDTFERLIRAADVAMYSAKRNGEHHRLADPTTGELALGELLDSAPTN